MKKRYNYRIYPNKIQREYIESIFNINRFIWNQFLAANIRYYNHSKKFHFFNEMSSILTECKNIEGYEWLKSVPSTSLQQTLRHLDRAIKDSYKKKKGFPKFKKKYDKNSFTLTNLQYSIKENKLKIALLKSLMKVKWHRELPSEPTSCTIIKDNIGRYYVSFVVEVESKMVLSTSNKIGLDLGIETFRVVDNGREGYTCATYLGGRVHAVILENKRRPVVTVNISGPTQTGKTIIANEIATMLQKKFGCSVMLSGDLSLEEAGTPNYHYSQWELDMLKKNIWKIEETGHSK